MSEVSGSTATYEGWQRYVEYDRGQMPDRLTRAQLQKLTDAARGEYNVSRTNWHANILIRTPQVDSVHEHLGDLVDSNAQGMGFVRPAAAIDSPPSLGKSTTMDTFGKAFYLAHMRQFGPYVDNDQDILRIPVCKITLPGEITIKALHLQIDRFYAHPTATTADVRGRLPSRDLAASAAESVRRHATRLMLIDDIHFLNPRTENGEKVANELKWLANEYPATFVFAGVGLKARGLFSEGHGADGAALAQTGRRWTHLKVDPFDVTAPGGDQVWHDTLLAIERNLVLSHIRPGMLTNMHDYLFIRSTGVIGSLMSLMRLGAARAVRTGREQLDEELLEKVLINDAAEAARGRTTEALTKHRRHHPLPKWGS